MCRRLACLVSLVMVLGLIGADEVLGRTFDIRIATGEDDVEQHLGNGDIDLTSTDLELAYEDDGTPATDAQIIGLRFVDIPIGRGTQILSAYVEFEVDSVGKAASADPVNLVVEGELTPDAPAFLDATDNITDRPSWTSANVKWSVPAWTATNIKWQTPDISAVIQEIVNQAGWASGNALVLIFSDDADDPSTGLREAESFDGEALAAPLLHMEVFSVIAMEPDPADGATAVTMPLLQWTPGDSAVLHEVYFGTNPSLGPAEYMGQQGWAMYFHRSDLVPGATYYWRIDEVAADGKVYTGDVWSFTAAPLVAYSPDPADGAKYVATDTVLSWIAGITAIKHDVYFGTSSPPAFIGNQFGTTYDPAGLLQGATYYWRIDEVEAGDTVKHEGAVWSFTTMPDIPISDPNLIGWWKLDGGSGSVALDWSGLGNDGDIVGSPLWVEGYMDSALELTGSDYIAVDAVNDDITSNSISLSVWVKTTDTGAYLVASNDDASASALRFGIQNGNAYVRDDGTDEGHSDTTVSDDEWHMLTYVRTGSTGYIYVDGYLEGTHSADFDLTTDDRWSIGQEWDGTTPSDFYIGAVDDVRFYRAALTQDQIKELMRVDPLLAWDASPANKSVPDIEQASVLSWRPGDEAVQHDVYFGTDPAAVASADITTAGIYRGRQSPTVYIAPAALELGRTYYWRIDENNNDATVSTGEVWSFTVAMHLTVDDFEDYNDFSPDRVFQTWIDGFGYTDPPPGRLGNGTNSTVGYLAAPFAEQTTVHGGGQSMPFGYDNTALPFYSETGREFLVAQNFMRKGVTSLSLWVYGDPNSAPAHLYIGLQDSTGIRRDVTDTITSRVRTTSWQEVYFDLSKFAPVNLMSVKKMYIGVGNRLSPSVGGAGDIFVDDIRLYGPRCVASLLKPANDLNDDCVVDYLDVEILSDDWLLSDVAESVWDGPFTNADIGVPSAAGSYSFDGTTYTVTGNGHDIWDDADDFQYAYRQISGDCQMTVRVKSMQQVHAWAKAGVMIRDTLDADSSNAMIALTGGDGDGGTFQWRSQADPNSNSSRTLTGISPPACVRLVREGDTFTGYIFLDGRWQQEGVATTVAMTDPVYIGLAVTSHTDGVLETATFDRECTFSVAELNADGVIDFKDYAALADTWLDEALWPAP